MSTPLNVLLHPVRWRVVQHLARGRATPTRLQQLMPDTPAATLYRHLQTLAESGLIAVVEETPVRGAVERTYALAGLLAGPDPTPQGRQQQALLVLSLLQADLLSFLEAAGDAEVEGLSMTRTLLHATPEELQRLQELLRRELEPLLDAHEGSRPFSLGLLMVPGSEDAAPHSGA